MKILKNDINTQQQLKQAAKNIRNLRIFKNLSQTEMADILGTTQAEISHWENGKYFVREELKYITKQILGCSENQLLGIENTNIIDCENLDKIRRVNVINLMIEHKMSQTKLANSFNPPIKKQFISSILLGKRNFNQKQIEQIARIFNINLADLDREPQFSEVVNFKNRNNSEITTLTLEILDSIKFENAKHKSRMFPIAYDIIEDFLETENQEKAEEEINEEEMKLKIKKQLLHNRKIVKVPTGQVE